MAFLLGAASVRAWKAFPHHRLPTLRLFWKVVQQFLMSCRLCGVVWALVMSHLLTLHVPHLLWLLFRQVLRARSVVESCLIQLRRPLWHLVHRSRVLAQERINGGSWLTRAVDHILEAKKSGQSISDADLKKWLENFEVRPVFTAHPTEAARRSVLSKLSTISELLDEPESPTRERRLAEAVDLLWQTDELRLGRPEPLDEAINALYYLDDLFRLTIPEVLDDFSRELSRLGRVHPRLLGVSQESLVFTKLSQLLAQSLLTKI
jgi:hypothetical protein